MHTGELKKTITEHYQMRVETSESACDTQRQGKTPTNNCTYKKINIHNGNDK